MNVWAPRPTVGAGSGSVYDMTTTPSPTTATPPSSSSSPRTLPKTGLGPSAYRMKRRTSRNGYDDTTNRDPSGHRLIRYDALMIITEGDR